jgi:glutamate 5-kinase
MAENGFNDFRRLVVKIGSALLVDPQGQLNRGWLGGLLQDVAELHRAGKQVLIVSSGAVALGAASLGLNRRRARLEDLQAAAATGQIRLAQAYQELLAQSGIAVAQILLTPDDTEVRRRFLNARGTLERLLELAVVPVVNENDTVATDELRYGDNDRLAARVAQMVMADGLILLSDVDGLYTADPRRDSAARHIGTVDTIGDDIVAAAGDTGSHVGSGGMRTKVQAARIAMRAGCSTLIARGNVERPLAALAGNARCTVFRAPSTPAVARKQWLAGMLEVRGQLRLDDGAARALAGGKSLLPVGIVEVVGSFGRGDAVMLVAPGGGELGRGLVAYSSEETATIRGCRSQDIERKLGYRGRAVVVHRDDLVLFADSPS